MELERFFSAERALVDAALEKRLRNRMVKPRGSAGEELRSAMRYSALASGKRLRPLLAVASFRACGARGDAVYGPACALELIHAYSLVHDDLPDFDDDSLRRGRPTSHIVHGERLALVSGFALLAEGLAWLAEQPSPIGRDLLRLVTRAIGLEGMIGGQHLDLRSEGRPPEPASVLEIHAAKTGRLIRASVEVGARMAEADARLREGLGLYGEHLGLAFQIADDLLDALGDQALTGKSGGTDAAAGKATFVSVFGPAGARAHALAAAERARRVVLEIPVESDLLLAFADFVAARAR